MSERTRYYAAMALADASGDREAAKCWQRDEFTGLIPEEVVTWHRLLMDLDIRVDSPEHLQLNQLSAIYDVPAVHNTRIY